MTARLRLAGVQVQPLFMIDDGENLAPAPEVQPVFVKAEDWPNVVRLVDDGVATAIAEFTRQAEAQAPQRPPNRAARRAKPKTAKDVQSAAIKP